jgi:hypothetical protein
MLALLLTEAKLRNVFISQRRFKQKPVMAIQEQPQSTINSSSAIAQR